MIGNTHLRGRHRTHDSTPHLTLVPIVYTHTCTHTLILSNKGVCFSFRSLTPPYAFCIQTSYNKLPHTIAP